MPRRRPYREEGAGSAARRAAQLARDLEDVARELGVGADRVLSDALSLYGSLVRRADAAGLPPGELVDTLLASRRRASRPEPRPYDDDDPAPRRRYASDDRMAERLPLDWIALRRELDELHAAAPAGGAGEIRRLRDEVDRLRRSRDGYPVEAPPAAHEPLHAERPAGVRRKKKKRRRQGEEPSPVELYRRLRDGKAPEPARPRDPEARPAERRERRPMAADPASAPDAMRLGAARGQVPAAGWEAQRPAAPPQPPPAHPMHAPHHAMAMEHGAYADAQAPAHWHTDPYAIPPGTGPMEGFPRHPLAMAHHGGYGPQGFDGPPSYAGHEPAPRPSLPQGRAPQRAPLPPPQTAVEPLVSSRLPHYGAAPPAPREPRPAPELVRAAPTSPEPDGRGRGTYADRRVKLKKITF